VIWLIVLSTALVLVWGASEQWHVAGLRRRAAHVFRPDRHRGEDDREIDRAR